MICPMAWRCRGGENAENSENDAENTQKNGVIDANTPRKPSEVGRKIFVAAKKAANSPVITRSPKSILPENGAIFDDVIMSVNNNTDEKPEVLLNPMSADATADNGNQIRCTKV